MRCEHHVLSMFLFLLQTNLRRFIECIQQLETDKVEKMLDRGLDPNYHDPENGGSATQPSNGIKFRCVILFGMGNEDQI